MALPWTTNRDALSAALATARGNDRAALAELLARLNAAGAAYDLAVSAGGFEPASGGGFLEVWSSQAAIAHAAALRGLRALEALIPAPLFTPADTFTFDASTEDPIPASVVLDINGAVFPAPPAVVPPDGGIRGWPPPPAPARAALTLRARFAGPEGRNLAVRLSPPAAPGELAAAVVTFRGRTLETTALREDGGALRLGSALVAAEGRASGFVAPTMPTPLPLGGGGTGGVFAALAFRASVALGRASWPSPTAAQTLARSRVEALAAEAATVWAARSGESGGEGPSAAERRLAGLMDEASRMLGYLAAA